MKQRQMMVVYGLLCCLAWGLVWQTSRPKDKRTIKAGYITLAKGLPLHTVRFVHGHDDIKVWRSNTAYWMTIKGKTNEKTYRVISHKGATLFQSLQRIEGKVVEQANVQDTGYKLTASKRGVLTLERQGQVQTLFVGGQTFGQKGFYVTTANQPITVVDVPALRWLRFGRSHLPDNHLTHIDYKDVARVTFTAPDGSSLDVRQKMRAQSDYSYWVWPNRDEGGSRIARRWVRAWLRLRHKGAVLKTPPKDHSIGFTVELFLGDGQTQKITTVRHQGKVYATSPAFDGNWVILQRKAIDSVEVGWENFVKASKQEVLYAPPDPNVSVHNEKRPKP